MTTSHSSFRVGLVSDTHGLLRPQVLEALAGSDFIVHAGDIGDPAILGHLAVLAPVTAVRGNNDIGGWASAIPERAELRVGGARLYLLHNIAELDIDPAHAGFDAVISGHSHRPYCERRDGVWFINPGSAGPRRFQLPVALAQLVVSGRDLATRLVTIDIAPVANATPRS